MKRSDSMTRRMVIALTSVVALSWLVASSLGIMVMQDEFAEIFDSSVQETAERLLLELRGKLGADIGVRAQPGSQAQADILQALLALGYNDKEAAAALKALPAGVGVSEGIKLALKALAK